MVDLQQLLKDKDRAKRLFAKWQKEYYRLDKEVRENCPHSDTTESSEYDSGDDGYDRYIPCTSYKSTCDACGKIVKSWTENHYNARRYF